MASGSGGVAGNIFWLCAFLIVYTYLLYPLLIFMAHAAVQIARDVEYMLRPRDRRVSRTGELPRVSVLVPVHNEATRLGAKREALAQLDYPADKLQIIFVSDGSTDGSNEYLERVREPNWTVVALPERKGKANALNEAVRRAEADVLVLCDASTLIPPDGIRKLVRHFGDPSVGLVACDVRFSGTPESAGTEGVYWKYETMLRLMEARLGVTLAASGPLYALRRDCYRPLATHTMVDDLITSLRVRQTGRRVVFDPEVVGIDYAAAGVPDEFKRRVRLAIGSFRAFPEIVRTPPGWWFTFAFFSHKLLRWCLPLAFVALLFSNLLLHGPFYRGVLAAQAVFYALAAAGHYGRRAMRKTRFLLLPYFVVAMHAAFVVGFVKAMFHKPVHGTWERVT